MATSLRHRKLLDKILQITGASILVGALIGVLRSGGDTAAFFALQGSITGGLIGCGCSTVEFLIFSNSSLRRVRRLPPVMLMASRALAYSFFILLGLAASGLLTIGLLPWQQRDFLEVFLISAAVSFAFSTAIEINRLLGAEATAALVTGRYSRPRLEERIVLFADIVGSTALAEKIGELAFHNFLQEVALDLAGPIDQSAGDVYRYVGDAVIVTWPLARGLKDARCLECAFQLHKVLERRKKDYQASFGHTPRIRVALHCGQVATGEIGDWKKEIALLGDTMNTAARIEGAAKVLNEATLLSNDIVGRLPDSATKPLRRLEPYQATGKSLSLTLWAADCPDE